MKTSDIPRVSIGVPVYNGERYIAETLDSLLAQTFTDFELVICDNASTDRTAQICQAYTARDARVRYVRNPQNIGASRNYTLALGLSSGEYFRWANSDDLFAPEGLARCVDVLDRDPSVVLAYPRTKFIDEHSNVISEYADEMHMQSPRASERFAQVLEKLGYVNVIYGLMRANILRHTGLLRAFPGGDIPLVAELSLYGKFHEIPEFLFFRRLHSKASSSYKDNVSLTQEFFDPSTKGKISLRNWRHLWTHAGSVMRAPLGMAEKMRLWLYILRRGIWKRDKLARELADAVRHIARRARARASKMFTSTGN
jgi:glycosyltransferase involved in cell wall biosynthesis